MPCRPTPGDEMPIQRVPSGLPGPGGTGSSPAAHAESGGYHQGLACFWMISKRPMRRRVLRAPDGDAEHLQLDAALRVERDAVERAVDDDRRRQGARGDGRLARPSWAARPTPRPGCLSAAAMAAVAFGTSSLRPHVSGVTTGTLLTSRKRASMGSLLDLRSERAHEGAQRVAVDARHDRDVLAGDGSRATLRERDAQRAGDVRVQAELRGRHRPRPRAHGDRDLAEHALLDPGLGLARRHAADRDARDRHARGDHALGQRRSVLARGGVRGAERQRQSDGRDGCEDTARPEHTGSVAVSGNACAR